MRHSDLGSPAPESLYMDLEIMDIVPVSHAGCAGAELQLDLNIRPNRAVLTGKLQEVN